MKTRIVIYLCLVVLIAAGLFYITQRGQTPTGLATGTEDYPEFQGKVYSIKTVERERGAHVLITLTGEDGSHNYFYTYHDYHLLLATTAYQTQSECYVEYDPTYTTQIRPDPYQRRDIINFQIQRDAGTTNADIVDEIKNAQSGINQIKRWLRYIWYYVYRTYRRVR